MKGIKLLLVLFLAGSSLSIGAQSLLPPMTDNQSAQLMIKREITNLELLYKSIPSVDLERKLYLYQQAMEFLSAPMTQVPSTESAVTSAFLIHEMKWNGIEESEAQTKFNNKQWSKEFKDLVNLVKYY